MLTGGTCNAATSPSVCAYTSDGGAALNNCQINTCCVDCVSDEDALAKKFGTVCVASTNTGQTTADTETFIRIEVEAPVSGDVIRPYICVLEPLCVLMPLYVPVCQVTSSTPPSVISPYICVLKPLYMCPDALICPCVSVGFFNANGDTYMEALAAAFVGMGLAKDQIKFEWVKQLEGLCLTIYT